MDGYRQKVIAVNGVGNDNGSLLYADAESTLAEADYAIMGVSFEETVSHRKGTRLGPYAIREESYNFETYHFRHDYDVESLNICDVGTLIPKDFSGLSSDIRDRMCEISGAGAFPIVLGGEHSITPFIIKELKESIDRSDMPGMKVLSIDAHLDFRDSYLGERNSHACSTRRIGEIVGLDSIMPIGVRSFEKEEFCEAREMGLDWVDSYSIHENGMDAYIDKIDDFVDGSLLYLTLDMDGIDPAFAPGVGTPEPFGLTQWDVLKIITNFSRRMIGMDVVEICPPYDNGNTSALACRLIGEMLASRGASGTRCSV